MKLIFIVGLPTTGKSMLGARIKSETGIHFLDIDDVAHLCFGPPERDPYATPGGMDRDRKRMFGAYNVLATAANFNLTRGDSIIVAATFSRPTYWNDIFLPIAKQNSGTEIRVVWCRILNNEETAVTKRVARDGYNGACKSLDHYLKDRSRYIAPPEELPQIVVDTSRPLEAYINDVLEFIK